MEVPKEIYCICGKPYDDKLFMIQCDNCREWYHGNCVNVREYVSIDLDKYHCPRCEVTCGPSVFKKQYNYHRHNYSDMDAEKKPVQTGTPVFVEELKTRHFPSADPVVTRLNGHQLTIDFLHQNGFDQPVIVDEKEGLDLRVPSEYFTVQDVEALVGSDREVDVIDVARQSDIKMTVGDFVSYFNNPMRQRVLNLISLEFSDTKLSELVEAPYVARKLDWVNTVWPLSIGTLPTVYKRPEVQKYCLIGVKDSYTDFHIDFGGTSVWYHVLRGEKIFYLIKPTMANLSLYQRWMTSSTQHETFFGDQVDCCYRCIVPAGHTMMIPTGWIHAVLTPVDTLVFGGNFLHSLNIPMQLQVYDIEKKMKTPGKFRFPAFETINWYAAKQLCEELRMLNDETSKVPAYLLQGVKALLITLKQWSQDRDTNKSRKEEIPSIIDAPKLLKDLSKEIRHAEKYLNSLHPPKPERESKRKKKKPVNKDFVDYSQPQNSVLLAQMMDFKSKKNENVNLSSGQIWNRKLSVKIPKVLKIMNSHLKGSDDIKKRKSNSLFSNARQISSDEQDILICTSERKINPIVEQNLNEQVTFISPGPLLYPYTYSKKFFKSEDSVSSCECQIKYDMNVKVQANNLVGCKSKLTHEQCKPQSDKSQSEKTSIVSGHEYPIERYKIAGPSKSRKEPLSQLLVHFFNTTSEEWKLVDGTEEKNWESSSVSAPSQAFEIPQALVRKVSFSNPLVENSNVVLGNNQSVTQCECLNTNKQYLHSHDVLLSVLKRHTSSSFSSCVRDNSSQDVQITSDHLQCTPNKVVEVKSDNFQCTSDLDIKMNFGNLKKMPGLNVPVTCDHSQCTLGQTIPTISHFVQNMSDQNDQKTLAHARKTLTHDVQNTSNQDIKFTLGEDVKKNPNHSKNILHQECKITFHKDVKNSLDQDILRTLNQDEERVYGFPTTKCFSNNSSTCVSVEKEKNLFSILPCKTMSRASTTQDSNISKHFIVEKIPYLSSVSQKNSKVSFKNHPKIQVNNNTSMFMVYCSSQGFMKTSEEKYDELMSSVNFHRADLLTSNNSTQSRNDLQKMMKLEPKEPIKLSMKLLHKKLQVKEEPVVRPPLKLTLPKPVMYPYTTPLSENKQKKDETIDQAGVENKPWFIAMDRSRHVKFKADSIGLKVKLAKQAELPFINLPPNPPNHQSFQEDYLDQKHHIDSVYDFHDDEDYPDDDDNCLTIDESPKKRRWSKGSAPVEQSSSPSLKAKWAQAHQSQIHLNNLLMNLKGMKTDNLNSVDVTSDLPKNGIDELLKASGYTREESPHIEDIREDIESGRTSPSTREAIAGMLSISRMYQMDGQGEPSSSNHHGTPRTKKKKHHNHIPHLDDVEDMEKVHQDDDFIYPSLDLSDEEEERTSRGGKRKVDEAWNPKARVGHVAPKTDRPCREGAKKQSVEKGLEAAAAKRASLPSPKRPYHRKRPKFVPLSVEQPSSSHSNLLPSASVRQVMTVDLKNRKPKKGMATAKQRLGKILKLHKMYH